MGQAAPIPLQVGYCFASSRLRPKVLYKICDDSYISLGNTLFFISDFLPNTTEPIIAYQPKYVCRRWSRSVLLELRPV